MDADQPLAQTHDQGLKDKLGGTRTADQNFTSFSFKHSAVPLLQDLAFRPGGSRVTGFNDKQKPDVLLRGRVSFWDGSLLLMFGGIKSSNSDRRTTSTQADVHTFSAGGTGGDHTELWEAI